MNGDFIKISNFLVGLLSLVFLGATADAHSKDDQTLEVWAMGAEGKKIAPLAKEFEEKHPGVRVVVQAIPWGSAHEKLITAVAGETTPDVCQLGSTWVSEFRAMQMLLPLDEFLQKSSLKREDFFQSAWKVNVMDQALYGIPWYVDTRVLFYRKDLLAEAGFPEPPKTWDELLAACRRLAADVDGDGKKDRYGISLPLRDWTTLLMFVWQNGGEILSDGFEPRFEPRLERAEVAEAFRYYANFFKEGLAPKELAVGTNIFNAFDKGFLPMFISGPWMLKELHEQLPHREGQWGVATLPRKKTATSFVGGSSLVIFKNTAKPDLAWQLIEFLSGPEVQARWYEMTEDLPSNKRAWQNPYFEKLEMVKVFGKQLEDTKSSPSIPEWEEIANVVDNGMERAIFEKEGVDEILHSMAGQIRTVLQKEHRVQSPVFKAMVVGVFCGLVVLFLSIYFFISRRSQSRELVSVSKWGRFRRYLKSYGFIIPSLSIFAVFLFAPVFISLLMSFTNWDIRSIVDTGQVSFVGLENYKNLVHDRVFLRALWNTFVFVLVGGSVTMGVALFAAMLLNSALVKFRTFFRVGFFTPVVTTMVAVAVVWRWLYNPRFGLVNWALSLLGLDGKNWLGDAAWALPALMLMAVWKNFGYHMVIFLAGLQGIPPHLYEAAQIDGAGRVQSFFHVTLPLLRPTIFFVAIMTSIGYFQFFAEPYIMTDGGPLDSTVSVILHMYRQGFKFFHMGYASSIAYALFLFIAAFSLLQFRLNRQNFEY